MIEAGSETTSSSLNSCIKYLAANPEVQQRAHEELSKVIGESRTPTFDDESDLPYIRAIVKEILRIRPVTNIGTPHYSTADVTYGDYFIPKGTVISINQYAIHFDRYRYDDPEAFKPERYLRHPLKAGAYSAAADPYDRDHFGFGAGRRICPGMHLAENSLFITLAKILWAFEIRPHVGADGKEEVVDVSDDAYEEGSNTLPKQFQVRFIPRSKGREEVVRGEWERAQKEGYLLGGVKVTTAGMVAQ
jgi:cytochrome P450